MELKILAQIERVRLDSVADIEELFIMKNQLNIVKDGYTESGLITPEWVDDKVLAVESEIKARVAGTLQKMLRNERNRRTALMTDSEKRKASDTRIADLEKRIASLT